MVFKRSFVAVVLSTCGEELARKIAGEGTAHGLVKHLYRRASNKRLVFYGSDGRPGL